MVRRYFSGGESQSGRRRKAPRERCCRADTFWHIRRTLMTPSRLPRWFSVLLLTAIGASAFAAPRIPLEDFVRDPDFARMQMSPDGLYTAFLHEYNDHSSMYVGDLATMSTVRFDLGMAPAYGTLAPKEAISYALSL